LLPPHITPFYYVTRYFNPRLDRDVTEMLRSENPLVKDNFYTPL